MGADGRYLAGLKRTCLGPPSLRPAVFLDRDGVINQIVWRGDIPASPRSLAEFVLEPGVAAPVRRLAAAGYLIFVVTNQPDIRRGKLAAAELAAMNDVVHAALRPDALRVCPHDDRDHCHCRKPQPGMLLDLAREFGVALDRSWMIGDQDRDMACGRAAGCATIQLARSYNTGAGADHRVSDLAAAAGVLMRLGAFVPL